MSSRFPPSHKRHCYFAASPFHVDSCFNVASGGEGVGRLAAISADGCSHPAPAGYTRLAGAANPGWLSILLIKAATCAWGHPGSRKHLRLGASAEGAAQPRDIPDGRVAGESRDDQNDRQVRRRRRSEAVMI